MSDPFIEDHIYRLVKSIRDNIAELNERLDTSDVVMIEAEREELSATKVDLGKLLERVG